MAFSLPYTNVCFQNRVLVSRVDPGSLAEKCLVLGDHLCDVDGIPVTDKDVARDLLVKNLQEKGKVSFVVERPDSIDAKQWAKQALSANVSFGELKFQRFAARTFCN